MIDDDYGICMGTGDVPSSGVISNKSKSGGWKSTQEEKLQLRQRGLVQDSTGHWYDPNNPIDCYFADW